MYWVGEQRTVLWGGWLGQCYSPIAPSYLQHSPTLVTSLHGPSGGMGSRRRRWQRFPHLFHRLFGHTDTGEALSSTGNWDTRKGKKSHEQTGLTWFLQIIHQESRCSLQDLGSLGLSCQENTRIRPLKVMQFTLGLLWFMKAYECLGSNEVSNWFYTFFVTSSSWNMILAMRMENPCETY